MIPGRPSVGNRQNPVEFSGAVAPPAASILCHAFRHMLGRAQVDQFPVYRATPPPVPELDRP